MSYVIRVVDNIAKWNFGTYDPRKLVDADPIGHLKTTNNALSVFVVNDISNIDHIAIAISTAPGRIEFRNFHCVIAEKSELWKNRIYMKYAPNANTPVEKANRQHWDVMNLKARDLEKLARIFQGNVNKKGNFMTIMAQKIKQLVKKAINDSTFIKKEKMNPKLLEQL